VKLRRISPYNVYTTIFAAVIAAYIILSIVYGIRFPNGSQVRDPFLISGSILASIGVTYSMLRCTGEKWYIRGSWIIFSVAYMLDNLSSILQVYFGMEMMGFFPALLIMVSYSLIAIGIGLLPSSPRPTFRRSRRFIDMSIIISISMLATWMFLIIPTFVFKAALYDQSFTALTYVMVFAVFDLLIRRQQTTSRRISWLVAVSIAMTVIGEILLAIQRNTSGDWFYIAMNVCWLISYACMGVAGISVEFLSQPQGNAHPRMIDHGDFFLPAIWTLLNFLLLIWSHFHSDILAFPVVAAGAGCFLVILLVRYNQVLKENFRLITDAEREIDSRKKMQEKFWHDSRHDVLTSLPNRSYIIDQLQASIDLTRETGKISSAFIFLDLDRFKPINDKYGHDVGDHLLKAISERLIFCVRPGDFVGRLGGDEFAILLNDLQSSSTVSKIASRIMDKMKDPFEIQGNILVIGVSFGICYIQPEMTNPDDILKISDNAMYTAKRKGRGRFETGNLTSF
jgi:diguanylate cyclase (GGDEF)-like protein